MKKGRSGHRRALPEVPRSLLHHAPGGRDDGDHEEVLRRLGVAPGDRPPLRRYLEILAAWSRRINLTGARNAEERVLTLIAPALPLVSLVEGGTVLDVGSGNGSPGLVLALLRPDLEVTLLEPRARRAAFLREATRATGREEIAVFHGRHVDFPGPPVQTLLLRALRLPLVELQPLVAPGGSVFVLGRPLPEAPGFGEAPAHARGLHRYRRST